MKKKIFNVLLCIVLVTVLVSCSSADMIDTVNTEESDEIQRLQMELELAQKKNQRLQNCKSHNNL